jgi:hypothetical protein
MAETTRPVLVSPRAENPFSGGEVARAPSTAAGSLVVVEAQRMRAEVEARMIMAHRMPRDQIRAMELILNDCCRPTLAQQAVYQYARGGTDIHGPTIRLVEAAAQRWGNIQSGFREVARHDGYSEVIADAWDLESGFYDYRQFQVRHWRDTRQGGHQVTDERDIYEVVASVAQRRKRAVLLSVIPGDVIEAALEQCEKTMTASADVSGEGIKKLVAAFAEFGVTVPQIEARIQRRMDAIRPAQVVMLRKIYTSIKDGMSEVADWFDAVPEPVAAEAPAAEPQAQGQRSRGRPRRPAAPPPADPPDDPPPADPPSQPRGRVTFEV